MGPAVSVSRGSAGWDQPHEPQRWTRGAAQHRGRLQPAQSSVYLLKPTSNFWGRGVEKVRREWRGTGLSAFVEQMAFVSCLREQSWLSPISSPPPMLTTHPAVPVTGAPAAPKGALATLQSPRRGCCNSAPWGHRRDTGTLGDVLQRSNILSS